MKLGINREMRLQPLVTPFESDSTCTWAGEYPRPQMRRESCFSLAGEWSLKVKTAESEKYIGDITVPFPPESRISGVERQKEKHERYVYEKSFTLPDGFKKDRIIINFGAVDQIARVFINDATAGEHTGGYIPFSFDVTDLICEGENVIAVEVTDETDKDLCYGKQSEKRGGMWYTPVSGIWQTVWLESVPESYVKKIKVTPTLASVTIETEGGMNEKRVVIGDKEYSYTGDTVTIEIESPVLWSPENPHLYDFTLTDGEDEIASYFALRTITVENGCICLNKKPYFFHGVLDQGYYSDGIFTPASPRGYEYDILTMKKLGFNALRKHVKIEPDLFYYYCDRLGMIVFQDMINSGEYHYITDTVLPTVGFKKSRDDRPSAKRRADFEKTLCDMTEALYNHPSVCLYTIFNEGWGQYDADRLYEKMKKLDKTRIWNATSGWFKKKKSDVVSEHVYFKPVNLKRCGEKPLVLTEFGGYSYKIEEHSFNLDKTYGYKKFTESVEFSRALESLYVKEVIPSVERGLCAAVLTQLSDVEDETNGLVTYDRQIVKVDEKLMQSIAEQLKKAFEESLEK